MSSVRWIDFADDFYDILWFAISLNLLFATAILKLVWKNSFQFRETLIVLLFQNRSNVNIAYILQ